MDLGTFEAIILIMVAMAVVLPIFYWGIPWFCKKVFQTAGTAESPESSLFKRLCLRSWRTLVATLIVLWGVIVSLLMTIWKILKFFFTDYQPDQPPGKRHAH